MDFGAAVWGPMVARAGGVKETEDLVCFTVLGGTARAHRTPAQKRAGFPGTNIEKGSRVRRAARFWNGVVQRGQGDLVRAALVESCEIAAPTAWERPSSTCHT